MDQPFAPDTPQSPEVLVQSFYADPHVFDILHTPGTANEVNGLERICQKFARTSGDVTWLEPACGTGRYLRVAAGRGINVVGFDTSSDMIEYAQRRIPTGKGAGTSSLFVGDMVSFTPPVKANSIDMSFNTINTIRHLETDDAMLAHFECTRRVLKRGGIYVVGVSITDYVHERETEDVWHARRGHVHVDQAVQYLPPEDPNTRTEIVCSIMTVTTPKTTQQIESRYTLRTYDRTQWDTLMHKVGFRRLAAITEWGDEMDPPRWGYTIEVLSPV
ncbi:MAG: class I SAM-dependent methyltransferase [Phycisphaeraceae bacterium]|nr:class I SAM-dependent methyltransferase [Phycisphaerales bacterium]MCB9861422.1 class I SAM-dependent methyltransferase [Phycisphaeraceae bacterium]